MAGTGGPTAPILPVDLEKIMDAGIQDDTQITLIATTPPAAIDVNEIKKPIANMLAGQNRLLVLRDPQTHHLHIFDRNVKEDLFLTFTARTNRKIKDAVMNDADTNSWWTIGGKAIEGPLKGSQLKELPLEENLYWGAMKYWYPQLNLAAPIKAEATTRYLG